MTAIAQSPAQLESAYARATGATDLASLLASMKQATLGKPPPGLDERLLALGALERAVAERSDAIVDAIGRDFGHRSKHETLLLEVYGVLEAIRHTKVNLSDWVEAEARRSSFLFAPSTCEVVYQPLGVVGILSPWNYPLRLALMPLVSALAAGNRAIIKPSEFAPHTAALLVELSTQAFAPDHVAVVTGGADVGEAFARLPFDHIIFTGSTRVGKLVMRAASENLVPLTLELGGKSPVIVGTDFNIAVAASRIIHGKTINAGQTCIAPDYAFIPSGTRDAFVQACRATVATAFPSLADSKDYTAIANDQNYARIVAIVDDAKARGAVVVPLGRTDDRADGALAQQRKIAPTLILDPTDAMLCMQEEIFGPVLPVLTYEALGHAIAYVNARPRPLSLYYFGHDRAAIDRVTVETLSGGVTVNETALHGIQNDLPFGGVGASGMGHYQGRDGFEALSKKKPIFRQSRIHTASFLRPPYGRLADRVLKFLLAR